MWKITKIVKKGNYLYGVCKEHPRSSKWGYVLLHRLIAENTLGRILQEDEIVHHINHDKYDNRPENLQVMSSSEHGKLHGLDRPRKIAILQCPQCNQSFERFDDQTKARTNAFCSRSCNAKYSRNNGNWVGNSIPISQSLQQTIKVLAAEGKTAYAIGKLLSISANTAMKYIKQ